MHEESGSPSLRDKLVDMKHKLIVSGEFKVTADKEISPMQEKIQAEFQTDVFEDTNTEMESSLQDEEELLVFNDEGEGDEDDINDAEEIFDLDEEDVEPEITENADQEEFDLGPQLVREIPELEIELDELGLLPSAEDDKTYAQHLAGNEELTVSENVEISGEEILSNSASPLEKEKSTSQHEEQDDELLAMEREFFGIVEEVISPVMSQIQEEEREEEFVSQEQAFEKVLEEEEEPEDIDFFEATKEYIKEETVRAKAESSQIEREKQKQEKISEKAVEPGEKENQGAGLPKESPVFLRGGLDIEEEKPQIYSLIDEFKKNKRNRNTLFYAIIFGFILLLGAGTFFISRDIQEETKKAEINIKEFDDINLQELVNTAKEAGERISKLQSELQNSKEALEGKLDEIRRQAELKLAGLKAQNLTAEEKRRLESEIRREEQKRISGAQSEFERQIASKQGELNQARSKQRELEDQLKNKAQEYEERLKERMADYEKQLKTKVSDYEKQFKERLEKIQEQATTLRQSHQGELKETRELYEAKMKQLVKQHEGELDYLKKYYTKQMENIQIVRDRALDTLKQALETQKAKELAALKTKMQQSYDELKTKNQQTIAELESVVKKYRYAFAFYSSKTREHGYVIDARADDDVVVEVNRFYRIKPGDQAVVSNDLGETLARIEFVSLNGFIRAKIIEREKDKKIRPFDRILLEISNKEEK